MKPTKITTTIICPLLSLLTIFTYANAQQVADSLPNKEIGTVDTEVLNVRVEPDIKSEIVGKLYNGETVEITENLEYWLKISLNEKEGWVYKPLINISNSIQPEPSIAKKTVPENATTNSTFDHINNYAKLQKELAVCMSRKEIKQIIGEPADIERVFTQANTKEIWKYVLEDQGILYITFLNDNLIFHQLSMLD